ncbi:maleylpyruvate isomerase N-terminal domain-containing protein, partial [Nocardioides hankookensis]
MTTLDFAPATKAVSAVLDGIRDDQLADQTPCPGLSVADLLEHLGGLALAFTCAATKEPVPGGSQASFDGSLLSPGWRDEIPAALARLAEAWVEPA